MERALLVDTSLLASADLGVSTFVNVFALSPIGGQAPTTAGRTSATQIGSITQMRTAAVVHVARVHNFARDAIGGQSHSMRTRAYRTRLFAGAFAQMRTSAVVMSATIGLRGGGATTQSGERINFTTGATATSVRAERVDAVHTGMT